MATIAALRSTAARRVLIALAVIAGLLATLALHTGAASASTSSSFGNRSAYEKHMNRAVLHLINVERERHGLHPLHSRLRLAKSAHAHSIDMAHFNVMSHQLPREAYIGTRVDHQGYHWSWVGENIAWSSDMHTAGVEAVQRQMYNENPPNDGHRRNILSKHYKDVGIDVYLDRLHHKVWLTTDFGHKMH